MNHRLLLGSTALVGAGVLLTSPAFAQEVGGLEVMLGGYTEFGAKAATDETNTDQESDRNYHFYMDNEVFINATGTSDGGIEYGSEIELEVGSGDGNVDNAFTDEVGLFFSGGFGRIELGREDGAEDVMGIGGEDAQSGTGGIDGDTTNLEPIFEIPDTGDAAKVSYFTPRIAGFQLGASFVPDSGDGIENAEDPVAPGDTPDFENVIGAGANWEGDFGAFSAIIAGTGIFGDAEDDSDDLTAWEVGALLGFGGLEFGAKYGMLTDFAEGDFANAGLKYSFGAASASVGWTRFMPDEEDDNDVFFVSGDVGLLPGVVLKGDVSYALEDEFHDDVANGDTHDTIAGVLSVQLNY
jgi:outer membrane protein OmpU